MGGLMFILGIFVSILICGWKGMMAGDFEHLYIFFFALIFGGIMATAVFSYLMQTRSVGAMHALPQRRGTLFWTHFLTGWAMLAAGNLLVLAVTALTALLGGLALTPALLTWWPPCWT